MANKMDHTDDFPAKNSPSRHFSRPVGAKTQTSELPRNKETVKLEFSIRDIFQK
jgi:hypothetical protein